MEQTLYMLFFVISFILLLISVFYTADWQLQGLIATVSFIFWLALAVQSLNIELITYSETATAWQIYRVFPDSYIPMGFSLIFAFISFLNGFIIFTTRPYQQAAEGIEPKTSKLDLRPRG